jgi:hypothetical protein
MSGDDGGARVAPAGALHEVPAATMPRGVNGHAPERR